MPLKRSSVKTIHRCEENMFLSQSFSVVAFLPQDLLEQPLHLLCLLGFHGNLAAGFMSLFICVSDSCSSVLASSKTYVVSIA